MRRSPSMIDALAAEVGLMTSVAPSPHWPRFCATRWSCVIASLPSSATDPKTIPEIAELLGAPVREVTHWVMAMRRYGKLEEMPETEEWDDYFRYEAHAKRHSRMASRIESGESRAR